MKTGCHKKEITGSVQEKNGDLYISLNLYIDGKRKPKMINTGLSIKGYHLRAANKLKKLALNMLNNEGATLDEVMDAVEGTQYKKRREVKVVKEKKTPIFMKPDIIEEMSSLLPPLMERGNERRPCNNPTGRRGDTIQVAAYFRQWLNRHSRNIEEDTQESYRMHTEKRIIAYFSLFDIYLSELENYDITTFYDFCARSGRLDGKKGEVSTTTVHRVHSIVHKALNDAVGDGLIKFNPASSVTPPKNNSYIPEYYTEAETNAFLNAAKGDLCEVPLSLAFIYGARRSEVLGIKIGALDFDADQIIIRHKVVPIKGGLLKKDILKSKKSLRALPMYPEVKLFLMMILKRHEELRQEFGPSWNPEGYLCVKDDGTLIHPNTVTKHYKGVAKKAGTKVNRLHDARHTNASLQVKKGVNIRHLQGWLGHSDIKVTERYSHFDTSDLMKSADVISSCISLNLAV